MKPTFHKRKVLSVPPDWRAKRKSFHKRRVLLIRTKKRSTRKKIHPRARKRKGRPRPSLLFLGR
jgi:hypothetical protein